MNFMAYSNTSAMKTRVDWRRTEGEQKKSPIVRWDKYGIATIGIRKFLQDLNSLET